MIKLRNFFKSFGPKNVLRSLDLDIDSGEIIEQVNLVNQKAGK